MALLDDRGAKHCARDQRHQDPSPERWNPLRPIGQWAPRSSSSGPADEPASVDLSWATVYRTGDYTAPHSHLRAQASIVYCIDPGDDPRPDTPDGKLCLVDPRYSMCCNIEPNRMTNVVIPDMRAGSMIMFPGELVHCVNPYAGTRPRLTLSWNINQQPLPGSPLEGVPDGTM
jgi:hypothetical protein